MATTFTAIIDNGVTIDMRAEFLSILDSIGGNLVPMLINCGFDQKEIKAVRWKWSWDSTCDVEFEKWIKNRYVSAYLGKPSVISLGITSNASVVHIGVFWKAFTENYSVQDTVRMMVQILAKKLRANSGVYLPEDGWPVTEKAVENIRNGIDYATTIRKFVADVESTGSFADAPKARHNVANSISESRQFYFDRWTGE